jgi:hypothetical protein
MTCIICKKEMTHEDVSNWAQYMTYQSDPTVGVCKECDDRMTAEVREGELRAST